MKRWLAVLLSVALLLPTLLVGVQVSAADDRIIATIPYTLNVNKTIGADGFLDGTGLTFNPIDVSAYSPDQVALEVDLFMSGDVNKFKSAEMQLELTSSGRPDSEEYNWGPQNFPWESGKWFRITLPLSSATGKDATFRMNNINFMRLYVVNLRDEGGKYVLKLMNARLVDVTKGEATDPIGDGSFTPNPPDWRLAPMTYPTEDTVVMGYNLADYFENAPGKDATAAIQSLLDGLRSAGGGTLFIPAGEYEVRGTLLIPEGVTLCGDWRAPTDEHPEVVGTILKAYAGRGNANGEAFITMLPNSTVRNLSIWYPEQDPQNIVEYPMTIKMFKAGNWGADYVHVRNITLVNSFQGIQQGPDGSGCPNIHNVYGTPLMKGVQLDGIYDVGRFDYIHFAPKYWINSGLPGAPTSKEAREALENYLMSEGIAFNIRQDDWSYFAFNEISGYSVGMTFTPSENRPKDSQGNPTGSDNFANGQCYAFTITNCDTAIAVINISQAGQLFSNFVIKDCNTGIGVRQNFNPLIPAGNMVFSHSSIDADIAILHEGELRLEFLKCTIERGEVIATCGPLTMTACTFKNEAPYVVLERGATGAIFLGNTVADPKAQFLDNQGLCPVKIDHTPIEIDEPDLLTAEEAADKPAKPARTVLYVASQLDKTGQTDVTDGLQALLNQAGNEGGGIVFLPGGHYRLNGSITIPSGVELKGAVDIGRIPFNIGSILKVYGGKGEADGTPTVKLSANSGIRGIVFDYPEQQHLSASGQQVQAYPYAMQGMGENIYVVNVSLRNAYNGLDLMTYRCDNHYVLYMAGFCLNNVIKVGSGAKGGVISNLQFNSGALLNGAESKWGSWPNSPRTSTEINNVSNNLINKYVQERMIFMQIGHVEDAIIYNNFTYLGHRGVQFIAQDGKAANGKFVGNAVDFTTVGFEIQAIGDMDIINAQIVSYLTRAEVNGMSYHVYVPESFTGKLNIFNLACWARPTAFVRVDGGTVNLYNSVYDSNSTSNQFALIGEKGKLNLLNGALYNRNLPSLVNNNPDNLLMQGFFLERELQGITSNNYKNNLIRLTRWSAPENAYLDPLAEMVFTEAFTGYPTQTVNGIRDVLSNSGAFNTVSQANANSNVTLANVDFEWDAARLFLNQSGTAVYMQNRSTRLTPGEKDSLYKLESRVRIDSLCAGEDAKFEIAVYNMQGNEGTSVTALVTFSKSGVEVNNQKLADWELNTWYRVGVEIDLRDKNNKTYTVYLYDDQYKLLAKSAPIAFDESYQGNDNSVGNLRFAMYELTDEESQAEAFVDYVYISKRDVSSFGTKGDVNGDGKINTTDARLTLQRAVGKIGDGDINTVAADVNGDGKINTTDARLILQFSVRKITEFPA